MLYKTRGNTHPQGKPRVYFTGHPKDIALYFVSLSDMILKRQNCAVFYDEDPAKIEDEENYFSDLRQMQLIVIVVTSRFLYQENHAFSVVLRYAMEQYIPVLPIMMESGLESEFNRLCGDLQFLDPNANDGTAISFDEKLTKYLDAVLVGDELAAKVRAAFDAYVFLSYRKKDRRYAQEFMRLIHQNAFCRDIAIWYDEFLVPGENFNDSIRDALEKSDLFALVVTPNLVNEDNYVMTTEYPMARAANKKILPAQLQPTNQDALHGNFPQIPDCTDPHDEKALSAALLESLAHVARTEKDDDPQHNFFIGLAYLSGIDVEVDYARALGLITLAADSGLQEAIEKLVAMYQHGEGVARNYETAIEWQRKLAKVRKQMYQEECTKERCLDWFRALMELGVSIFKNGQSAEAMKIFESLEQAGQKAYDVHAANEIIGFCALASEQLGDIYFVSRRNLPAALACYERAMEIQKAYPLREDTGIQVHNLGAFRGKIAAVCAALGDYERAEEYYRINLMLWEEGFEDWVNEYCVSQASFTHLQLGEMKMTMGNAEDAFSHFTRAVTSLESISELNDDINITVRLMIAYEKRAEVYQTWGKAEAAYSDYRKALALREETAEKTDAIIHKRSLSNTHIHIGVLFFEQEQLDKALVHFEKSVEICKSIVKETDSAEIWGTLYNSYNRCADVYIQQGKMKQAGVYYDHAMVIAKRLAEEMPSHHSRHNLSISYHKLGDLFVMLQIIGKARENYDKGLEIAKQLVKEQDTWEMKDYLATAYFKQVNVVKGRQKQLEVLQRAYGIWKSLSEQYPDIEQFGIRRDIVAVEIKRIHAQSSPFGRFLGKK